MKNYSVCLIGNNNLGKDVSDGQRVKTREFINILNSENIPVDLVDLEMFKSKPFKVLKCIKNGIKNNDIIIFISASRGVRTLLPFINHLNRKYNKRFVLPLIGSSVLHYYIDGLSKDECFNFLLNDNVTKCRNKFLSKQLSKIDLILPETELLTQRFKSFYSLSNVKTFPNLKIGSLCKISKKNGRYAFISRINVNKGIFDLIKVVDQINFSNTDKIYLDIYGDYQLTEDNKKMFDRLLMNNGFIHYKGVLKPDQVINVLSSYDYLVFPTKFVSEGIPGIVIESLIAGTPVISSSYPQSGSVLKDGLNSIVFKMDNQEELKKALVNSQKDETKRRLTSGAISSSTKYIYSFNRENFYECILGVKYENN